MKSSCTTLHRVALPDNHIFHMPMLLPLSINSEYGVRPVYTAVPTYLQKSPAPRNKYATMGGEMSGGSPCRKASPPNHPIQKPVQHRLSTAHFMSGVHFFLIFFLFGQGLGAGSITLTAMAIIFASFLRGSVVWLWGYTQGLDVWPYPRANAGRIPDRHRQLAGHFLHQYPHWHRRRGIDNHDYDGRSERPSVPALESFAVAFQDCLSIVGWIFIAAAWASLCIPVGELPEA